MKKKMAKRKARKNKKEMMNWKMMKKEEKTICNES